MAHPRPAAVVELLKPITWFPPMWAFGCGVVSSGVSMEGRWPFIVAGILLAGPLVCATSQAVNDWYDRHVDAINEPNRPIPSGRIPGTWGFWIAVAWTLLSAGAAASLGPFVLAAAIVGLLLAWAYSAPPLRLKRNGWWGNAAVGACYEGLPWLTGAAVMAASSPDWRVFALAGLYSFGAHGIMTLNDFKSVKGDTELGIRSLPVQLGVDTAALVACAVMLAPQVIVVALLFQWDRPAHAWAIVALFALQLLLMRTFIADPVKKALFYSGFGVPLYVSGMLVAAFALGGVIQGGGP